MTGRPIMPFVQQVLIQIITIIIAINCSFVYAEESPLEVINKYLEPTYITPTAGIHLFGDTGKWNDQWFEGEVNNHLRWFSISNSFMMIKYDYGYDYYNIRFQDRINRIQIGFAGKI